MNEWVLANLDLIRTLLPDAGSFTAGFVSLAVLNSLKSRIAGGLRSRRSYKQGQQAIERSYAIERSRWFVDAFTQLVVDGSWTEEKLDHLTVMEACAWMGEPLPRWACNGWERVLMGTFSKPAKRQPKSSGVTEDFDVAWPVVKSANEVSA